MADMALDLDPDCQQAKARAALARADKPAIDDARALARGAARLLADLGVAAIAEFTLPSGRRADLAGLGRKGEMVIVEIKSGPADFRADAKYPGYFDWCDRFYFAVSSRFPAAILPESCGLIIADPFGGAVVRESPLQPLAPARRKALTLRFARCAAERSLRAL
ncbi:MmcB family DNA repair protein [Alkalicaulis satelles]|uniref:MmcB family DNA repair protein n=1 Tax=Alkalicaulis satelles TaxID=2609175 RepID=A0A5M6Z8G4_9PROT|nr:MmcB family DNA repair protein [Alkalicaulis satelles]KAA5800912.1 MmcB family DNA repair protein [Alkalicaulis satelles]